MLEASFEPVKVVAADRRTPFAPATFTGRVGKYFSLEKQYYTRLTGIGKVRKGTDPWRQRVNAMSEQLWAPWRLAYIVKEPSPSAGECFICRGLADADDRKNQIVLRTARSAVLLNKYPYNNGHVLVAPRRHLGRLDQLTPDELLEVNETLRKMVATLEKVMKPDGFNIGVNLGRVAGAGLPDHVHWHVVPRWDGDTNFMPAIADVKVISQSLEALYEILTAALATKP